MKRNLFKCAGLALAGLALVLACQGRAQGPPAAGIPGFGSAPASANQNYLPTSPPLTAFGPRDGTAGSRLPPEWRKPPEDPDINRDLLVTPAVGPWLILVHSYDEANGPSLARALALELRGPNYGLQAYIWNYGDDERKAELERARQEMERRKEALRKAGLTTDMPIRVPHMLVRVQCAVLVGGYKDIDAARHDLERIKKLKPLDPDRFHLPRMMTGIIPQSPAENPGAVSRNPFAPRGRSDLVAGELAAVNPFLKAFPVHNPSVRFARADKDVQDYAVLQRLNTDESYNLLKCRKPWTLAVKHYQVPTVVETKGMTGGFLPKGGLGGSGAKTDAAKCNAHGLAELLHRRGWDAYVLHTRFFSMVTVGSYDSKDDPRIAHDQEELAKLNQRLASLPPDMNVDLRLLPQGVPIPVPQPDTRAR
jgi:hypothetical protein